MKLKDKILKEYRRLCKKQGSTYGVQSEVARKFNVKRQYVSKVIKESKNLTEKRAEISESFKENKNDILYTQASNLTEAENMFLTTLKTAGQSEIDELFRKDPKKFADLMLKLNLAKKNNMDIIQRAENKKDLKETPENIINIMNMFIEHGDSTKRIGKLSEDVKIIDVEAERKKLDEDN